MNLSDPSKFAMAREIRFQVDFQRHHPGVADYFCGVCIAALINDLGGMAGAW